MKMANLRDVAPPSPSSRPLKNSKQVWQLNLDQVEAQTGRVLSKVLSDVSTAGASTQHFDKGNVLFSKLRPYLNKVVVPDESGIATTELVPLRPDPRKLDRGYLAYYLRSPNFVAWASNEVAGAKMPRVVMHSFWKQQIPLPPLAEQKRIAGILDAADVLRAKRRESLAQLDSLLQSTFLTLFGDPAANPMGWEQMSVGEAVRDGYIDDVQDGNHGEKHPKVADFVEEGIPFIMANCMSGGSLNLDNAYRLSGSWTKKLRVGFSRAGDALLSHKGTVGEVAIVPNHLDLVILSPQVTYYRTSEKLSALFLISQFSSMGFQRLLEKEAKQSTRAYIGITRQKSLPIIVPPLPLQRRFAAIVESVERQKARQRAHLAELDALFASLQHRAFRGEL